MGKHAKRVLGLPSKLAIAQMLIAAFLIWRSQVWNAAMMRQVQGTFGPGPWFVVCTSINFPVAILSGLWDRATFFGGSSYLDFTLLVLATGILWWWVGANIVGLWQRRSPIVPRLRPLRTLVDLALVGVGAFLGWYVLTSDLHLVLRSDWIAAFRYYYPSAIRWQLLFALQAGLRMTWAIALLCVFGRDLIHSAGNNAGFTMRRTNGAHLIS